jgi:hypothetical protein
MTIPVLILAGAALIAVALTALLTAVVIGIQRGDRGRRGHLYHTPECYSDTLSRRLLVGIRHPAQTSEEDSK